MEQSMEELRVENARLKNALETLERAYKAAIEVLESIAGAQEQMTQKARYAIGVLRAPLDPK
jgi:hypothetical protein